jgi:hypothetical protein
MKNENETAPLRKFKKALLVLFVAAVPLAFLLFPASLAILTGCVPQPVQTVQTPVPDYNSGLYSFPKFDLPAAKKPGSVGLTVLSVVPEYKDTRSETNSGTNSSMTREMTKVFKSFAGSAGEDIEALLVAKGLTAKGPFVLDEVTFPDKKGADLTVLMQIIFDIQYSDAKFVRDETFENNQQGKIYSGTMSIGMKVYYYLLEPLSEEKMWIKKLDLGSQDLTYEFAKGQESYVSGQQYVSNGCGGGQSYPTYAWRDTNKMLYDSRAKLFSDQLKAAYPQLMKTAWTYFDADEMLSLRDKAKEIRDRWGSSSYRRGAPQ